MQSGGPQLVRLAIDRNMLGISRHQPAPEPPLDTSDAQHLQRLAARHREPQSVLQRLVLANVVRVDVAVSAGVRLNVNAFAVVDAKTMIAGRSLHVASARWLG